MERLALIPEKLPESETLEFQAKSAVVDGSVVMQFLKGKNKLLIDLSLSARLGKGLLGHAEAKVTSEWVRDEVWRPARFSLESSLWGAQKKSQYTLQEGQLDPLSVGFALRNQPIKDLHDKKVFATRDESRVKTVELYATEKKHEENVVLGPVDLLKLEFREQGDQKKRPDYWAFWVESQQNILTEIQMGHEKLGHLIFKLTNRRFS